MPPHSPPPLTAFHDLAPGMLKVIALRLLLAAILGLILGVGRERLRKTAGMRTHMVVCIGAAMFAMCPILWGMGNDGVSRVIQGVVQGIGFLGAGAILKLSDTTEVKGLTTAASTWLVAAVGVACGLGLLWLALIGAGFAWIVLVPLGRAEKRLQQLRVAGPNPDKR
jgi:putative Mg2+ transporter-C (MgtC) family protein